MTIELGGAWLSDFGHVKKGGPGDMRLSKRSEWLLRIGHEDSAISYIDMMTWATDAWRIVVHFKDRNRENVTIDFEEIEPDTQLPDPLTRAKVEILM